MKHKLSVISLAVALTVRADAATLALGETIGIDFGTIASTAALNYNDFDGHNNAIANGGTLAFSSLSADPLVNTAGADLTDVDFSVKNDSGQATGRTNVVVGGNGPAPFDDATLYEDTLISNNQGAFPLDPGGFVTLTFSGLDDSLSYDLSGGYRHNNSSNNFNATWAADGQSFLTSTADGWYQTLSGLSTDGSGNLAITVTRSQLHVTVGALTLTAVPEPSAALLSGFVALGLLLRRRR